MEPATLRSLQIDEPMGRTSRNSTMADYEGGWGLFPPRTDRASRGWLATNWWRSRRASARGWRPAADCATGAGCSANSTPTRWTATLAKRPPRRRPRRRRTWPAVSDAGTGRPFRRWPVWPVWICRPWPAARPTTSRPSYARATRAPLTIAGRPSTLTTLCATRLVFSPPPSFRSVRTKTVAKVHEIFIAKN